MHFIVWLKQPKGKFTFGKKRKLYCYIPIVAYKVIEKKLMIYLGNK